MLLPASSLLVPASTTCTGAHVTLLVASTLWLSCVSCSPPWKQADSPRWAGSCPQLSSTKNVAHGSHDVFGPAGILIGPAPMPSRNAVYTTSPLGCITPIRPS